jgi:hypothetical protein
VKDLGGEQQFFKKLSTENETTTKVSFQISRKMSAAGKFFSEGEFVKTCNLIPVSGLRP